MSQQIASLEQPRSQRAQLPSRSFERLRALWGRKSARAGLLICLTLLVVALGAGVLAPHDPIAQSLRDRLAPPSSEHLLGTDEYGRDILSRILWGARISLGIGVASVAIALLVGVPLGLAAGYFGRWVETLIMRLTDMLMAFPVLLLALAIIAFLGFSLPNVIIAIAVALVPGYIRIVRASTLAIRQNDYITAAVMLGAKHLWIIRKHILPNMMGPVIVLASLDVATAILLEGALSFLGIGVPPPTPTWGVIIGEGRAFLRNAPWISTFAGLAISLAALGLNLLGDGLRDVLDPTTHRR